MKFTESTIAAFVAPPGKASAVMFDTQITGLGLKATAKGTKIFIFQFWSGSRVHRLTLGKYGDITLTDARRLASTLRLQVASGANPALERRQRIAEDRKIAEKNALTLAVLISRWDEIALREASPGYKAEATRALKKAFAAALQKPAEALTAAAIQTELDAIAVAHPTTARRVRAYVRAMFTWATKRDLVPVNPCASVVVEGREATRERVLTDAELGEAWRAAGTLPALAGGFVRLAMLTLQRRNEVAGMEWAELAPDLSTWTVPASRAKNRRAHLVHLPQLARDVLAGLPRPEGAALVFGTVPRDKDAPPAPISGFSDIRARLHAAIAAERSGQAPKRRAKGEGGYKRAQPVADWTLHDFRRTGVTRLAGEGVAPHVADRLLNHVAGSISGVALIYQRNEFLAEREAAMQIWEAYIRRAAGLAPPEASKPPARPKRQRKPAESP